MRLLVQRVSKASVTVSDEIVGSIGKGLLVFFGAHKDDTPDMIEWLAKKLLDLRIFPDDAGKMNRSVQDVEGGILFVSQFTLYADCRNGRRPDFFDSAPPALAEELYNRFLELLQTRYSPVESGVFAASMEVDLTNDGPVTIILNNK
jgi:D-tyrosyl-tRNA(Tyr) deacylase